MIDTIVGVLTQVPPEDREEAEQDLLYFAADAGHKQVGALGARIVAHLDPDGAEPDETEPSVPTQELSLRRKRSGVWELNGRFDDETGARASALLDTLAQRRTADDGGDFRSPQERYGDAFSDAIDLALNTPDLPTQAGERAHVMVAVSLEDLRSGIGQATLGDTGRISAAEARIHACDCKLIPAVLGDKANPSTSAARAARSRPAFAAPSTYGTAAAPSLAVIAHRGTVKVTTSGIGLTAARRIWAIWC